MWIDDEILKRCHEPLAIAVWVPNTPLVVLGSSNKAEQEVELERCETDRIAILKRCGGGGTVVLHQGCVVISIGAWVRQVYQNKLYFDLLNRSVIAALARRWPRFAELRQRGLSDITFADQKVAGTSLFRSRNYLLYQASLLVDPDLTLINRYLKHPSREPDYRQGRSHAEFLTGLGAIEPDANPEMVMTELLSHLPNCYKAICGDERLEPMSAQFPHLLQRASEPES